MNDAQKPAKPAAPKVSKERSPSYPAIPLKTALERLERFEKTFGRHPAPFAKVGMAWGIKEGSSQSNSVLAALKAFGLIVYHGAGKDRTATVSEDGRTYLRAQQEEVKKGVIKRAALRPKAIAQFWPTWGTDRPPDAICLDDLVLKHGFNDNAAPIFLRVYDDTIAFAGLSSSDKVEVEESDEEDSETLGDGEEPIGVHNPVNPVNPGKLLKPLKEEVKLMANERILTTGLLSKEASFRLIVNGHVGAKEIDRLIQKLTLDKEILAEQDEPEQSDVMS